MSKTNQTLRDVLRAYGDVLLNLAEQAFLKPKTIKREAVERTVNTNEAQALKEISELLVECKPEKRNSSWFEQEFGIDSPVVTGYNLAVEDCEHHIKARLQ